MLKVISSPSTRCMPERRSTLSSMQPHCASVISYADPLDEDRESDPPVTMSHRQLARLLFIASDTGGRFEREHCAVDPVAWLYSPRELFSGSAAVQACQSRTNFIRAIILHGLSIGLDAEPEDLDSLMADDAALTFDGN